MYQFLNQHVLLLIVAAVAGGALAVRTLWRSTPRSCLFTPLSYDTFRYLLHCLAAGGGAAAGAWFFIGLTGWNVSWYAEEAFKLVASTAELNLNATVTPFTLAVAGIAGGISSVAVFLGGIALGIRSSDANAALSDDDDEEDEEDD